RLVELIVNGEAVASREVPADGKSHDLTFDVEIAQSSWVALRQFPQLHTNPVDVLVAERPIRGSVESARWCHDAVENLWNRRSRMIDESERPAAAAAYERARQMYLQIAREARGRPGT